MITPTGTEYRLPTSICHDCKAELDVCVPVTHKMHPDPGDIACCKYCQAILEFDLEIGLQDASVQAMSIEPSGYVYEAFSSKERELAANGAAS